MALNTALKERIQGAYRAFLASKSLRPRYGQRLMIAEIARCLGNVEQDGNGFRQGEQHICVVEAGTGTGKTVAYALATIPIAQALEKQLVISTATVALQEQIVFKDLPDIQRHSGLQFSFALAKGRSRYVCLLKLDNLLRGAEQAGQTIPLYPDEYDPLNPEVYALYRQLLDGLASGEWDGDRDNWAQTLDDAEWTPLTSDRNQCSGRSCPHISSCSFYKAREDLNKIDVVVANHDLVLADLALGGGAILSEPEETIYVFDEGHHLPDKTLSHFSYRCRIDASRKWIEQSTRMLETLTGLCADSTTVSSQIERALPLLSELSQTMAPMQILVNDVISGLADGDQQYRFPHGVVPDAITDLAVDLEGLYDRCAAALDIMSSELNKALEGSPEIPREVAEHWYPAVGQMLSRATTYAALWGQYAVRRDDKVPDARWINIVESSQGVDFELCSSPILAADNLMDNLWRRCFSALVTSATMTALGNFERFMMRAGTPRDAAYAVVPSPFNYQSALLRVPRLSCDPSDNEGHTNELVTFITEQTANERGVLVLFSSWRQMLDSYERLSPDLRKIVMLQGDYPKHEILRKHRERIDAGDRSLLFGLASFAEGVDLPGDYCQHVVIAKIPFAVPDDPVEASLAEWIEARGGNAFMEISVPDAALRLVQAAGRLLRTESDSGTISLLDRRATTRRYGQAILDSLPPFQRRFD